MYMVNVVVITISYIIIMPSLVCTSTGSPLVQYIQCSSVCKASSCVPKFNGDSKYSSVQQLRCITIK